MNAGERAIVKEERRLEKERKRRIELANRMLIPVGGKTLESIGLSLIITRWILKSDTHLKVFLRIKSEILLEILLLRIRELE